MSSDRFHKAAKDGLLDVLREANKREVNHKDVDGMTPVLWAAFEGRLDALRLLVGRGGEPDKSDQFGNTALHLAAAKGHLQCVDFLVKFGVNLYSLDIDRHSAKDLAAINNRDDILRYLDSATAQLELKDRKKAKIFKENAEKQCEKRTKEYAKKQQKLDQTQENDVRPMPHRPSTVLADWKHRLWSTSQGNLKQTQREQITANGTKFSALVGGTIAGRGAVERKANAIKAKQNSLLQTDFKVGEIEPSGKRSVRSLQGVRRDSEVIYVGTFSANGDIGKRGKIADVFEVEDNEIGGEIENETEKKRANGTYGTMARSFSQPDLLEANEGEVSEEVILQRPSGLFDRPMLGSLAFRRSVTAALSDLNADSSSVGSSNTSTHKEHIKPRSFKPRTHLVVSDSESDDDDGSTDADEQEDGLTPLERFLTAWGLEEHIHIFQKQQIDLDTLMLLTESDLKSLQLPLGPFRKLATAIQERKSALLNPGTIQDSRL
ncbi:Usher syndrome type-1G protein homolog [Bradysia coprophila]|uniref:Usher syndrome type-1G protein homolog n=1 Tax=Bradysia coprophila TaxID=38358 RepID=UPI00187DC098|nr:Usher syndrome type-1G protein homolog [Bradysia coprophila]